MRTHVVKTARVSTQEQNEARQLTAMRKFGVAVKNIIVEKLSGKDFNRPLYQRLMRTLRPEAALVIECSVKFQGIGRDLGMERWVLPMEDGKKLAAATAKLWNERDKVRKALQRMGKADTSQYYFVAKVKTACRSAQLALTDRLFLFSEERREKASTL